MLFSITTFLFVVLIWTGILGFQTPCGWKNGHLLLTPTKELTCHCLGLTDILSTSYNDRSFCTGINISYNKLSTFHNNESGIIYSKETKYTLSVNIKSAPLGNNLSNIQIGLYNEKNKLLSSTTSDSNGIASFYLPTGTYILKPVSGYSGIQTVTVSENLQTKLEVLPILN